MTNHQFLALMVLGLAVVLLLLWRLIWTRMPAPPRLSNWVTAFFLALAIAIIIVAVVHLLTS